jgi:hypothetical protein
MPNELIGSDPVLIPAASKGRFVSLCFMAKVLKVLALKGIVNTDK